MVDALGGDPGVYSARYGGEGLDDTGRWQLLLENMAGKANRACKFVTVITCCFPNGDVITARGECPGTIAFAPRGGTAFGYDPVFFIRTEKDLCPAHGRGEKRHLPPGQAPPWRPRSLEQNSPGIVKAITRTRRTGSPW